MRRSEIHAIKDWTLANGFLGYQDLTEYPRHNNVYAPQHTPPRERTVVDLRVETAGKKSKVAIVYEDVPLQKIPELDSVRNANQIMDDANIYRVMVLRDPFNMFASRLRMVRQDIQNGKPSAIQKIPLEESVGLWKDYAREVISQGETLSEISPDGTLVLIEYNKWVSDPQYRNSLMSGFFNEENNQDIGIEKIPKRFESTWDYRTFDGNAAEMRTGERWMQMSDDPEFRSIFNDGELVELMRNALFEQIQGTAQVVNIFPTSEN